MTAPRGTRILLALAILVWDAVLALYGLVALLYDADGRGEPYVEVAGREIDVDLAGGVALTLAVAAILTALLVLRPPARLR
jgi:hypothetical protein